MNDIVKQDEAQLMESVLLGGDLSKLTAAQRVTYYQRVCESVGLNPLTKPFGYITLNGKLVLYALKDATEQIRSKRGVSITQIEKQFIDDLYIVTAHAMTPDGRTDASTGAVTISNLKGDAKANAIMKAETKAKRRVTLSICGMGFLDESEVSSIPDARPVVITESGEIVDAGTNAQNIGSMTYEEAKNVKVKIRNKDYSVGDMSKEQLDWVIGNSTNNESVTAAKIVLAHDFQMEPVTQTTTGEQPA